MKKILFLCMCLLLVTSLSACSGGDIKVTDVVLEKPYIHGKIENTGDQAYSLILVEFYVFDGSGKMIHNYIHSIQNLAPGEQKAFSIKVVETEAESVKMNRIVQKDIK